MEIEFDKRCIMIILPFSSLMQGSSGKTFHLYYRKANLTNGKHERNIIRFFY